MQQEGVRHAIDTLKHSKRLLYDRGVSCGLCLWPHTSVDLNVLELNTDTYARDEVSRQRHAARGRLEKRIGALIDLRNDSGEMRFDWFSEGKPLSISAGCSAIEH